MMAQNNKPTAAGQSPSKPASAEVLAEEALEAAQASVDQLTAEDDSANLAPMPELDPGLSQDAADADGAGGGGGTSLDLLGDVDLHVTVQLGRTEMLVEDVLRLNQGSVVELDKLAGDPVDVFVNNRLIARGEVLVLNDNFCIRISEIVANLEEQAQAAAEQEIGTES